MGYTYALLGRTADASVHARWMQSRLPQMPYTVQLSQLLEGMAGRTFLAALRGTVEYDRIVARAAERVAAFRA